MLRAALPLSRRAGLAHIRSGNATQWPQKLRQDKGYGQRAFTDVRKPDTITKPSIKDSKPIVLPGSQSTTATSATPSPPGAVPSPSPSITPPPASTVSNAIIPPANVPLTPPAPPGGKSQITPKSALPPLPPPSDSLVGHVSAPPKKKPRRFRRFLLYLVLLGGLSYAGAVWYSLRSDNFHDFFTEYVPFGEDAVLYFEEREFRRRFPRATKPTNRPDRDMGHKITIPSKSGISWKVADGETAGSDLATKGRHMSALEENKPTPRVDAQQAPSSATGPEKTKAVEQTKKKPSTPAPAPATAPVAATTPIVIPSAEAKTAPPPKLSSVEPTSPKPEPVLASSKSAEKVAEYTQSKVPKMPEVDEPSVFIPITRIDPLKIDNAEEPLVQDLVKILNDIITVINADNSSGQLNSTITKAKSELAGVGKKILDLKDAERAAADQKVKATQTDFDKAARELVSRLEDEMRNQESKWKEEFDSERAKISQTFQDRLKSEVERSNQISELRIKNQLLEQAVAMKKQFLADVKDRVETERDGRLSKLSELSNSVNELEELTSKWNSVIDSNLKTQHLQVAVEAVRSSLERADRPRPFVHELAALKEIAANDPVVNSAIASINPTAYQRGVPTSGQLIDRFRRVAEEVRKASLLPEDAGVASHAASFVLSKVLFKKQGRAVGDDVESILTRTETLLEEGNLDEAAREMTSLTGWAKTLSGDWLAEARRVLEVRQALDVIATEARLQSLKVD